MQGFSGACVTPVPDGGLELCSVPLGACLFQGHMQWAQAGDSQSVLTSALIPPTLLGDRILAADVSVVHGSTGGQVSSLTAWSIGVASCAAVGLVECFSALFPALRPRILPFLRRCKQSLRRAGCSLAFVTAPRETFVLLVEVARRRAP